MTEREQAVQPPQPDTARRSWPRRMLNRLEVDRAVFYALVLRGWQFFGGAISVLLIARFFNPQVQGYYYTFASLMGLQAFFELGLNYVVVIVASHEWTHLKLGEGRKIEGDPQALARLSSLARLLFKWYGAAVCLFIVLVGAGGWYFLRQRGANIEWEQPWFGLVIFSGLLMWTLPFNALLEGCGQVASVNRFRVFQAVAANLAIWSSLILGWGLWVAVAGAVVRLIVDLFFLLIRYGNFFWSLTSSITAETIAWQKEIRPLQWRRGVTGISGYFAFFLFVPVMFHYHGEDVAGRMGMTWTLVTALQAAALSWIHTRIPRFGSLIAGGEFAELDRIYKRLTLISLGIVSAGSLVLWGVVYGLNVLEFQLATRMLPPLPTAIFLLAIILFQVPYCQDAYIRAHKRDPLLPVYVTGFIMTGLLVWLLGKEFGPLGAACGYLSAVVCVFMPGLMILWNRSRRDWH